MALQDLCERTSLNMRGGVTPLWISHGGRLDNASSEVLVPGLRAAAYIRMSTREQVLSPQMQAACLRRYAEQHGMRIVETYEDAGHSGLVASGRPGLRRLLGDITNGCAGYGVLLIYDVSRWGRYQNVDQAGFYEYQCRRAGIRVVYCAEHFADDDTLMSQLMKSVKRSMAAEYSRELSAKVFQSQRRLSSLGYKQGGAATYGMGRVAIGTDGRVQALTRGERKPRLSDRVRLVAGTDAERVVIRRIFNLYTQHGLTMRAIARQLNVEGIRCNDQPWTDYLVSSVLGKPQYWGVQAYNRCSSRLRTPARHNPPQDWIWVEGALEATVTAADALLAGRIRAMRNGAAPDAVLEGLRRVFQRHGRVTHALLREVVGMPGRKRLLRMFGSLAQACAEAGVPTRVAVPNTEHRRMQILQRECLRDRVCELVDLAGGSATLVAERPDCLLLNQCLLLRVSVACCRGSASLARWRVLVHGNLTADFVLAGLLDERNQEISRYALLDCAVETRPIIYFGSGRYTKSRSVLFPALEPLFGLASINDHHD